jgi:hypothetical protein|tara:strand:- start:1349 stop:1570 length:222 start_codon:yes stop_codon:yes gene_type:complete
MVVAIRDKPAFEYGNPELIFDGSPYPLPGSAPHFDVAPDGESFLILKHVVSEPEVIVVLNWFEELGRLVPHPK